MPNHITNIVRLTGVTPARITKIFKEILNEQGMFDFNRVIPMPEILKNTTSPNNVNAEECLAETGYTSWYDWACANWDTKWNAYDQKPMYNTVRFKRWHRTWTSRNWDKDHAYRVYADRVNKKRYKAALALGTCDTIQFQTAWSMPEAIMAKLSEMYPDVSFQITYADEDIGSNCGEFTLQDGEVVVSNIAPNWRDMVDEQREQWRRFACDVIGWEYNPEDYE